MFDEVKARLVDVAGFSGRWEPAAKFSELVARNHLPQVAPAGFILPLGLRGQRADAVTGLYRQSLVEMMGIVMVLRSAGDATGGKSTDQITELRDVVIRRIAGWAPDFALGVFTVSRGELVSLSAGTLVYQIDFALETQLRISTNG